MYFEWKQATDWESDMTCERVLFKFALVFLLVLAFAVGADPTPKTWAQVSNRPVEMTANSAQPDWLLGSWRVETYVPGLAIPPFTVEFTESGAIMTSSPARLRAIVFGRGLKWEANIGTPDCGARWQPVSVKVSSDRRRMTYRVEMIQAVRCKPSGSYAAYTLTKQ
jgi:hypothetical protein